MNNVLVFFIDRLISSFTLIVSFLVCKRNLTALVISTLLESRLVLKRSGECPVIVIVIVCSASEDFLVQVIVRVPVKKQN